MAQSSSKGKGRNVDADEVKPIVQLVSLKTLAQELDAHRSSVRRWLHEAGIQPVALGRGRNGAIRYVRADVQRWMESLERVS